MVPGIVLVSLGFPRWAFQVRAGPIVTDSATWSLSAVQLLTIIIRAYNALDGTELWRSPVARWWSGDTNDVYGRQERQTICGDCRRRAFLLCAQSSRRLALSPLVSPTRTVSHFGEKVRAVSSLKFIFRQLALNNIFNSAILVWCPN